MQFALHLSHFYSVYFWERITLQVYGFCFESRSLCHDAAFLETYFRQNEQAVLKNVRKYVFPALRKWTKPLPPIYYV